MTIISIDRREREATTKNRELQTCAPQATKVETKAATSVVRCAAWAEPVPVSWDLDPMAA